MWTLEANESIAMDDSLQDKTDTEISEAEALAADKKLRRRMNSMLIFLALLGLPVAIGAWRLWVIYSDIGASERWALAQIAAPKPDTRAWGVLGSVYLDQGKIAQALPLLLKATQVEVDRDATGRDWLTLAKAQMLGSAQGLSIASKVQAEAALAKAESIAATLAQGRAAATYFSAGLFYQELGLQDKAVAALSKAVALQADDWVDQGAGQRYKQRGIASYYAKMLAAATMPQDKSNPTAKP